MKKLLLILLSFLISFEIKALNFHSRNTLNFDKFEWCGLVPVYIEKGKAHFLLRKSKVPLNVSKDESKIQESQTFLVPPLDHFYWDEKRYTSQLLLFCDYFRRLVKLDLDKRDSRKENIYYMEAVDKLIKDLPSISYSLHKNSVKIQKGNMYHERCEFNIPKKFCKILENKFDDSNKPSLFDGNFCLFGFPIKEVESMNFNEQESKDYTIYFVPVKQKKWGDAELDENTQWFSIEDIKNLKNSSEFSPSFFTEILNHIVSLGNRSNQNIFKAHFTGKEKKYDSLITEKIKEQLKKFSCSPVSSAA